MTVRTLDHSLPPASSARWRPVTTDTVLLTGMAIQLALTPPTLLGLLFDARLLNDISVWTKPLKFQFSMALNLLTLFILLKVLPPDDRNSRFIRLCALAVAAASTFEIVYIMLQAARGVGSHYNVGTRLEALGYQLMGVGAVTMVSGAFLIGLAIRRTAQPTGLQGTHMGAWSGLMLGSVLTLLTAGVLSAGFDGPGHWVGGVKSDAAGLPLTGWSTTGGDLRVPHFFATHLSQALPLLGLLVDRFKLRRPAVWIASGAAGGSLIVVVTFLQALSGRPLVALS
jgi:hypothetical protein